MANHSSWSLNGFGTTYYGKREFQSDASYITTRWVIFGFMPFVPTQSLRVRPLDSGQFEVIEELGLNVNQIVHVYVYAWLLIPFALFFPETHHWSQAGQVVLLIMVALIPFLFREWGKRSG